MEELTSQEVILLTGVTYRQLDHWCNRGWVTPSVADAEGSGSKRRYAPRDVFSVRVMAALMGTGVSGEQAASIVAEIAQRDDHVIRAYPYILVTPIDHRFATLEEVVEALAWWNKLRIVNMLLCFGVGS